MVVSCKAVWKPGQIRVEDRKKNHDLAHIGFVALRPDWGLAPSLALERDVGGGGHEGHDDPPSLVATRHPTLLFQRPIDLILCGMDRVDVMQQQGSSTA